MTKKENPCSKVCCICNGLIKPLMSHDVPPKIIWDKGHNAEPIKDGQCCDKCNFEKVIPERLNFLYENEKIKKLTYDEKNK